MLSTPQLQLMTLGGSLLGGSLSSSLFLNSPPAASPTTQHTHSSPWLEVAASPWEQRGSADYNNSTMRPDAAVRAQALQLSATLLSSIGQTPSAKSVCAVAARLLSKHQDLFQMHQHQSSSRAGGDGAQRSCSLDLGSLTTTTISSSSRSLDLGPGAGWRAAAGAAAADHHSWDSCSGAGSSSSSGSGSRPQGRAYRRSLTSPALVGSRSPEAVSGPAAAGRPLSSISSAPGPAAAGAAGRPRGRSVCQVDGCHLELKGTATARHRVCARHLMEPAVVLRANKPLELYRFCNLCCKFERLECFDGTRRGCRAAREQEQRHQHHYRRAAAVAATPRSNSAPVPMSSASIESMIEQAMLQELAASGLTEHSAAGAAANSPVEGRGVGTFKPATAAEQEALLSNFLAPVELPQAGQPAAPAAQQSQQWPGSSAALCQSGGLAPQASCPTAMELDQAIGQPQQQVTPQQLAPQKPQQQPGSRELSFPPALLPSVSQDFASCCGSTPGSFSMPRQPPGLCTAGVAAAASAQEFAAADMDVVVADDTADWLGSICSPCLDDSCQQQDTVLLQLQQFDAASDNATPPSTTTYTLPDLPTPPPAAATQPPQEAAVAAAHSCAAGSGAAAGVAVSPSPAHNRPGPGAVDTSELQAALALKLQGMQEEARRMKHMINMLKAHQGSKASV